MLSGQGSQYYHMGKELYLKNAVFRHWMSKLNDLICQEFGILIIDQIYNPTSNRTDRFDNISYTHPAIFMIEYSLAQMLIESGIEPDFILGASLGEVTAVAIAGALSLDKSLECIFKQVELLVNLCQSGGMMAIIHHADLYDECAVFINSELAAYNYPAHFVISGTREKISEVADYLKSKGIFYYILPVSYGFHSSNIDPIKDQYMECLNRCSFKKPNIPIISSSLSSRVQDISPEYFWNIARDPIFFQKTITKLEEICEFDYIDLGPTGTLANFVKKNLSHESLSQVYDVLTPFGQDIRNFEKIKSIFY